MCFIFGNYGCGREAPLSCRFPQTPFPKTHLACLSPMPQAVPCLSWSPLSCSHFWSQFIFYPTIKGEDRPCFSILSTGNLPCLFGASPTRFSLSFLYEVARILQKLH